MRTIHIKNIGAVSDSGVVCVSPITIFCGKQGSGKSTIAKLISTCMWLEKALVKQELSKNYVTSYNRFVNKLCDYHQIASFFRDNSYLRYETDKFVFTYDNKHLQVEERDGTFLMPKIMYVPAERNFMVSVEHAEKVKRLPSSLLTLQEEYLRALRALKGGKRLYVDETEIQYDRLNKVTWLVGPGFKIKAQNAASGYQSLAPLVLVSDYLSDFVEQESEESLSAEDKEKLRKEIEHIQSSKSLKSEIKDIMIEMINNRWKTDCFWNIVEEPEQNLYPESQRLILNMLLKDYNKNSANGLIITTHSPYILSYLTLNIKCAVVGANENKTTQVNEIIPRESWAKAEDVSIYEIQPDGQVKKLPDYDGLPSDNNFLNNALASTNEVFEQLLEIEDA